MSKAASPAAPTDLKGRLASLQVPYAQQPTPYTLQPAPYTLRPLHIPYILLPPCPAFNLFSLFIALEPRVE